MENESHKCIPLYISSNYCIFQLLYFVPTLPVFLCHRLEFVIDVLQVKCYLSIKVA